VSPVNLGGRMFVAHQNRIDISDRFVIDGTPEPAPYTEEYRVPRSYHASPRAIDLNVSHDLFAWIRRNHGRPLWVELWAMMARERTARRRARIRGMHAAYGRRRGRGRR